MTDAGERIDVQYAITAAGVPAAATLRSWVERALHGRRPGAELALRIVGEAEMIALNRQYRGKDGPTNVLSFPYEPIAGVETAQLGDIVICAPVVAAEALTQGKPLEAHWAHMVIHGVLHLLGYDHHTEVQAEAMEGMEIRLLGGLGLPSPY